MAVKQGDSDTSLQPDRIALDLVDNVQDDERGTPRWLEPAFFGDWLTDLKTITFTNSLFAFDLLG